MKGRHGTGGSTLGLSGRWGATCWRSRRGRDGAAWRWRGRRGGGPRRRALSRWRARGRAGAGAWSGAARRAGPGGWARKVAGAAAAWGAHRVVAEANNGGKMVESVLKGADVGLPVKLVHASDGKSARAEPVAALFEAGRARLAGVFPELED